MKINLPYEPTAGGHCNEDGKKCVFNWFLSKVGRKYGNLGLGGDVFCRLKYNQTSKEAPYTYTDHDWSLMRRIGTIIYDNDLGNFKSAFLELHKLLTKEIEWFCRYAPESRNVLAEMDAIIAEYTIPETVMEIEKCPILT